MTAFCMQIVLLELLQEELLNASLSDVERLISDSFEPEIVQEKCSDLTISDADACFANG